MRFSCIITRKLTGYGKLGLVYELKDDLSFLKEAGINIIVNLEDHYINYNAFEVKYIPVNNFKAAKLAGLVILLNSFIQK